MKHIVLFGAGKSSTYLIEYLAAQLVPNGWRLTVLDADVNAALEKTGNAPNSYAAYVNVTDEADRRKWIAEADLVISLLPPTLHYQVALDCLSFSRNLLTASYVDDNMRSLHAQVKDKDLIFLCECGLDPGIDHMSAMQLITRLKNEGAVIHSFRSHCGGLVAPESNDNPWKYKISWNPRNVVLAGKAGAVFLENGKRVEMPYEQLFDAARTVDVDGIGTLCWYPNRDSMGYTDLYELNSVNTFVRTTLRYPEFCFGWKNVVDLQLTSEKPEYDTNGLSLQKFFQQHMKKHGFSEWVENQLTSRFRQTKILLEKLEELLDAEGQLDDEKLEDLQEFMLVDGSGELLDVNLEDVKNSAAATVAGQMHEANLSLKQLIYLGMNDDTTLINKGRCSAADVLQFALEQKLALKADDKDMIVMQHEIGYSLNGMEHQVKSSLVVKGEDHVHTAMAKTVGLPLGIAAKLVLQEKITKKGVVIPVHEEIYEPMLAELQHFGIFFGEK